MAKETLVLLFLLHFWALPKHLFGGYLDYFFRGLANPSHQSILVWDIRTSYRPTVSRKIDKVTVENAVLTCCSYLEQTCYLFGRWKVLWIQEFAWQLPSLAGLSDSFLSPRVEFDGKSRWDSWILLLSRHLAPGHHSCYRLFAAPAELNF